MVTAQHRVVTTFPVMLATTGLTALKQVCLGHHPSDNKLIELQHLAATRISTKNIARL